MLLNRLRVPTPLFNHSGIKKPRYFRIADSCAILSETILKEFRRETSPAGMYKIVVHNNNLLIGGCNLVLKLCMYYLFSSAHAINMLYDFARTPADPLNSADPAGVPSNLYHS